MRRISAFVFGLTVLLLYGCGAAKPVSKVYSASVGFTDSSAVVSPLLMKKGTWSPVGDPLVLPFERQAGAVTTPVDTLSFVTLEGVQYAVLSYLNAYSGGSSLEYVLTAVTLESGKAESFVFSGKNLGTLPDYRIEGVSNISLVEDTPAMRYMASLAATDSRLVELSEADYLTDKAVEWWLSQNPSAMGSARKFEYGAVPSESSLVMAFDEARKERSGKYQCSVVDVRGYTCLVVYDSASVSYLLAWALPECKNRRTQWYLKNYYFETSSTIAMIFYKGNSMAKYRINLANRTVTRS